jgi:transposase
VGIRPHRKKGHHAQYGKVRTRARPSTASSTRSSQSVPPGVPPRHRRRGPAKGGSALSQIAKDFGISESCLHRSVRRAEIEERSTGAPARQETLASKRVRLGQFRLRSFSRLSPSDGRVVGSESGFQGPAQPRAAHRGSLRACDTGLAQPHAGQGPPRSPSPFG